MCAGPHLPKCRPGKSDKARPVVSGADRKAHSWEGRELGSNPGSFTYW